MSANVVNFKNFVNEKVMSNYIFGSGKDQSIIACSGVIDFSNEDTIITDLDIYELYDIGSEKLNISRLNKDGDKYKEFYTKHFHSDRSLFSIKCSYTSTLDEAHNAIYLERNSDQNILSIHSANNSTRHEAVNIDKIFDIRYEGDCTLFSKTYVQILVPFTKVAPLIIIENYTGYNQFDTNKFFSEDKSYFLNSLFDCPMDIDMYEIRNKQNITSTKVNNPLDSINTVVDIYDKDEIIEYNTGVTGYKSTNFRNGITKDQETMLDESGEIDREYNDITLGDFLLYQYEFYKPSNITEVYHTSIDTYHDDGAIMDHVDLRERDLEDVSLEDIDETIIDNFFNCSNIYDEEDKGDVSIFKYNKENPLPHTIKISKWKDEDIYELSSMELLDDASTDPETGATIQNDLKYTVTMYGNEYMMETYGYSEGTTNYITTNIFDCADDNRLIYRLNQETHLSLFETKIITTYDLDGLKFRIQNITETDISGTNLKAYKYIYESPELVIEIDHSKNTITSFSSPVYNIADSYVYVRNIWGTLEKLDISRFERIFK